MNMLKEGLHALLFFKATASGPHGRGLIAFTPCFSAGAQGL